MGRSHHAGAEEDLGGNSHASAFVAARQRWILTRLSNHFDAGGIDIEARRFRGRGRLLFRARGDDDARHQRGGEEKSKRGGTAGAARDARRHDDGIGDC